VEELFKNFLTELAGAKTKNDLMNLKAKYLGKDGLVTLNMQNLKDLPPQEKRTLGPLINRIKSNIADAIGEKLAELELIVVNQELENCDVDPSLSDSVMVGSLVGGLHPVTMIKEEIEDLFLSMGFEILDGPHIETEFFNFDALNIPQGHPARDMQDTFWIDHADKERYLLRTHTSSVQVRGMRERHPPFKFIIPGTVFRCERTDASHSASFYQLEGIFVDKEVSVANLIYFMKNILKHIFKKDVTIRLRPGFFPFVEPGLELDIQCHICAGKGCPVCRHRGWVELLPCGMIHPRVLEFGNIDPKIYSGFAFGLGLDRLVMMRYGINDIRLLLSGDLRFSEQF
jgi:phenylalanyl-tRNA synthetase alpha chain